MTTFLLIKVAARPRQRRCHMLTLVKREQLAHTSLCFYPAVTFRRRFIVTGAKKRWRKEETRGGPARRTLTCLAVKPTGSIENISDKRGEELV